MATVLNRIAFEALGCRFCAFSILVLIVVLVDALALALEVVHWLLSRSVRNVWRDTRTQAVKASNGNSLAFAVQP